jgi:dTDP-4-dehydrorhamnose 3,5-epimerase
VSNYYSPAHERGILWNDSALRIDWGVDEKSAILSERDRVHPMFQNAADFF